MYCTNCGKEIPDQSEFCEHCGARLSENQENQENPKNQENLRNQENQESEVPAPPKKISGKKTKLAAAAVVCVILVTAAAIGIPRFFQNPKQKIVKGIIKTYQAAVSGETTLNGILGLDQMKKEVMEGNTTQLLEVTLPEAEAGLRALIASDRKKKSFRTELYPTWNNMELGEAILYRQGDNLYFGLPDVLDDVFYVELPEIRDDLSGSAANRLFREATDMDLSDLLPEDEDSREALTFKSYCKEELESLYDDIEVEKDGKETVRINGKSQKCDRYQVTIPGSSLKDLLSKTVDYGVEKQPALMLVLGNLVARGGGGIILPQEVKQILKEMLLPPLKLRDVEMTVCLDKKGRVVACKGEWTVALNGESAKIEYDGSFSGGASPLDKIDGTVLVSVDGEEWEFSLDRDKKFDKKSGLKDQIELTMVDSWDGSSYTDAYTCDFSYNLKNGKWEFTAADDDNYGIQATGQISDVKKGKEMSFALHELTDLSGHYSYLEGKYELAGLGKEGVEPLKGMDKGIPFFDMSKSELIGVGADLAENWLMNRISGSSFPSSLFGGGYGYSETKAAPTTTAAPTTAAAAD